MTLRSWFLLLLAVSATPLSAELIHVSPDGNDQNSGSISAPLATPQRAVSLATRYDTVLLRRGSSWESELALAIDGTADSHLTVGAYGSGAPPVVFGLRITGDHTVVQDLVVDHQQHASDAVRIENAVNVSLINLEIRNGVKDGIDASSADGLLVDSCLIHHFLAGSFTQQADAHGIVASDSSGLVVRDTEIHHVSGDSFQTDPDRDTDTPDEILIEGSHLWTGPLEADFAGWNAGESPGENAIDTKMVKSGWESVPRMHLTVRNVVAHGWSRGYVSNRAAFNIKEKVAVLFDGVTVYDNEIAFRLRGNRGNAEVEVVNGVIFDNEWAIRAEDGLSDLKVYNSTFGSASQAHFRIVNGNSSSSWELLNNAFLDNLPAVADLPGNQLALVQEFVAPQLGDFHPTEDSALIDAGVPLPFVALDRDGAERPSGQGYDIGAFEYSAPLGNISPEAKFTFLCIDLTCDFQDISSDSDGLLTERIWDFGDGTGSVAPAPSHAFIESGTYNVSLSVRDDLGASDTATQSITVTLVDTEPPLVSAPEDMVVEATAVRTLLDIGQASSDDGSPVVNDAPADGFPLGTTEVIWSATDAAGNTGTAMQRITVVDTTPPVLSAPSDLTLQGDQNIGMATATDIFPVEIVNDAPASFPEGTTEVTWTATDTSGNSSSAIQRVTVVPSEPPPVNTIDFRDYPLSSFHSQDQSWFGEAVVEDGGRTLRLTGNRWKRIDFPYQATPKTVIEFDFYSGRQSEIHAIGMEEDNRLTGRRFFQLWGTQLWAHQKFNNYAGSGWVRYRIPVGSYYTGNMNYLVFVMDDDAKLGGESRFRDLRVYEE
ncbi:MAG: PKD domain-containing protein [Gammaproteobacteria bacterium]|nr:PKD domain-containing protein [Gammaproteobacteria bacterium]